MTCTLRRLPRCILLATLLAGPAAASPACLEYEPQHVELSGTLVRRTAPGPPEFRSVAQGDRAETGYYLKLDAAICVRARHGDDGADHDGVDALQVVLSPTQYDVLRPALGSRVRLRGSLFEAHTGHHHTPVLLRVSGRADE